jgi:membrane associated rhomboid family serine protease
VRASVYKRRRKLRGVWKYSIIRVARTIGTTVTQSTDSKTARIPVGSKRHAMDWSLVLLSQEIESVIDHSKETGWELIVGTQDYGRALEVIRQYRLENLRWPWRQKIHQKILFDWGSAAWVFLIILFFWLNSERMDLRSAGLMDSSAIARGEWWRLFTAIFLHADLGHLAANAGFGLVLLGLTMGVYGTGVGLLFAYLGGVGGNLATWLIDPNHRSLGASGMVMGCLGLLATQAISTGHTNPRALKRALGGIAAGLMLFLLLGSSPGTDLVAHAGGFATGVALGSILARVPRMAQSAAANLVAGGLFSLLVILTWWLALSGRR